MREIMETSPPLSLWSDMLAVGEKISECCVCFQNNQIMREDSFYRVFVYTADRVNYLYELSFHCKTVTDEGACALAESLRRNTTVVSLM